MSQICIKNVERDLAKLNVSFKHSGPNHTMKIRRVSEECLSEALKNDGICELILKNLNLKDIDNLLMLNSKWKQKYIYLDLSKKGSTNKDQIAEMRKKTYSHRHSNL